jgi:hypothetical protein
MSLEEIKVAAAALSDEERIWLSAYLKHLARVDLPENQADLSARDKRIDAGRYSTLEKGEKRHAALEAEGL